MITTSFPSWMAQNPAESSLDLGEDFGESFASDKFGSANFKRRGRTDQITCHAGVCSRLA